MLLRLAFVLVVLASVPAHGQVTSGDGAWIARTVADGHFLVIEDASTGLAVHRRALMSRDHLDTRAAALLALPARRSFLLALDGAPELWEIALDVDAGPFHDGFVHSWESGMEESLAAEEGRFARQRIWLEAPLAALAPMPGKRHAVIGTRPDGTRVEINLAVKRELGVLPAE